ncbi:nucleotide sugar dehydrogenase [Candidatus Woesearchaeota archaeon]|nr:nucleotide sugar dehydrogenase [Candidatus Woesearchaeota archaeon]
MGAICIIGLGRVGLPLSLSFCKAGYTVYGMDKDKELIEKLQKGVMPFMEKGAGELLRRYHNKTFLPSLNNIEKLKDSQTIIITLGTPVDEHLNPDYSQIDNILPLLSKNLQKNHLIILRSTISPGTTEYIKDILEKETKLKCGSDFFLAFCPERIAEGNALEEIEEIPQIIGGIDTISSKKAEEIFSNITNECLITDAKSAELAKIFTNMYRYINFAIANEFTILSMQHKKDIYEITNLINHNYKRGGLALPGFSAGPCLYKDGYFLLNNVPFNELISASWRINENLPIYLINEVKQKINLKNKKAVILGMSFKKNIDDQRNSLSFKIKKTLIREQCEVFCQDPFIKEYNLNYEETLKDADLLIIGVNHDVYKNLNIEYLKTKVKENCIVCDIWNILKTGKIIFNI